jgi:hypothetical protein
MRSVEEVAELWGVKPSTVTVVTDGAYVKYMWGEAVLLMTKAPTGVDLSSWEAYEAAVPE